MEKILAMEKDVKKRILEEEKNLLNSCFTQEDITILYEALEYIASLSLQSILNLERLQTLMKSSKF